MKKVGINDEIFYLPQSWAEVDRAIIAGLVRELIKPATGMTYHEILRITLGFSVKKYKKFIGRFLAGVSTEVREENAAEIHKLIQVLSWMWSQPLTEKPLAFLKVEGEVWRLPEAAFDAITWGELCDALVHYEVFVKQLIPGEKYLDLLVATLCRPMRIMDQAMASPDWNGDNRILYNSFETQKRADQLAGVSLHEKMSVLLYFAGVSKKLLSNYELSDGGGDPDEYPGQSMVKNTHNLAEKGVFGNFDQTRAKNANDVLIFLEENKKDTDARMRAQKEK